ncbi:hydroxyethylthiazole kinase [Marispirochaeta sp.]|uniref:hydroxyethylthiazole kinase n=1 Tax=Marispirochaeta sp. TaxID=2038653 RepID=UPI0029C83F34|nr:hydroxyethylthiazole kinase [Marispirochaeta sp.]
MDKKTDTQIDNTRIALALEAIKNRAPLIHHITNMVTVNDCANITLAFGAAPVMADWGDDALEMVEHAGALVLNMGVLTPESIETMISVGEKAKARGIPVVFDPVGAGATASRRTASRRILAQVQPDIVKGNAAEIMFLAGEKVQQKGVDSDVSHDIGDVTRRLADESSAVVTATGVTDYVSNGKETFRIQGGSAMMGRITGTGCMSASVLGCFAAVLDSKLEAALLGILAMNLAGEKAVESLGRSEGSGTFRTRLIDAANLLETASIDLTGRVRHAQG